MKEKYKVTWKHFVVSQLRQIPFFKLKKLVRISQENELCVGFEELETHTMAGGRPEQVIDGLVYAKSVGINASFSDAAALDLLLHAKKIGTLKEWLQGLHSEGVNDLKNAPFPN